MATLAVHVSPKSAKNAIVGWNTTEEGKAELLVKLTAVPADGKANEALIKLLAKTLRVPKSSISIASGQGSRHKLLKLDMEQAVLDCELQRLL